MLMSIRSLLLIALCACGSQTTYQSADTLPPGRWQGMIAVGLGAFADKPQDTAIPTGTVEIAARRGVGENTDLGLKLYTVGLELSIRQRLTHGTWSWALLGSLGGSISDETSATGKAALTQARLGAVATKRRSAGWAWNLGPTSTFSLWKPAGGGTAGGAMFGAFAGFDWRFGERWHLIPELSLHVSIAGDVPVDGSVLLLGAAFARDW